MPSAVTLRRQIEAALESRIPAALTPAPKIRSAVHPTGIQPLDELLQGGLPQGALTELVGPECSGRTSIALSFLARTTQQGKVCAWIDVSNTLDPESAASLGVDLQRLLWLRCGVTSAPSPKQPYNFVLPEKYLAPPAPKRGLHGGGFGPHPRQEIRGLSNAVGHLFDESLATTSAKPEHTPRKPASSFSPPELKPLLKRSSKPWSRMEQALRSADLLLQAGGFSAIVLDMGSLAPEFVSRIPLATWFRYRAAAERTQSTILLLTQFACAKSSAELVLQLDTAAPLCDEPTVFTGIQLRVSIARQRYPPESSNVIAIRKPPQRETGATWTSNTAWAGAR